MGFADGEGTVDRTGSGQRQVAELGILLGLFGSHDCGGVERAGRPEVVAEERADKIQAAGT